MGDYDVAYDGAVWVRSKPCEHCLFSKDRLVEGKRARDIINETRLTVGSTFVCHKSQVSDEPTSICRAWFDHYAQEDAILKGLIDTHWVREVDVE